jgi:hypothetical protein
MQARIRCYQSGVPPMTIGLSTHGHLGKVRFVVRDARPCSAANVCCVRWRPLEAAGSPACGGSSPYHGHSQWVVLQHVYKQTLCMRRTLSRCSCA